MENTMDHYHVTHTMSDNSYVAGDVLSALTYAVGELVTDTDIAYESISALGDAGDFEGAYKSFKEFETLDNLQSNLSNVIHQYVSEEMDRAPLFTGLGWQDRLDGAINHVVDMINSDSLVSIYPCSDSECEVEEDE